MTTLIALLLAARVVTHEVSCDDPLETATDCRLKARQICQGDFKTLKLTETDKVPAAGNPFHGGGGNSPAGKIGASPSHIYEEESKGGSTRRMTFSCVKEPPVKDQAAP